MRASRPRSAKVLVAFGAVGFVSDKKRTLLPDGIQEYLSNAKRGGAAEVRAMPRCAIGKYSIAIASRVSPSIDNSGSERLPTVFCDDQNGGTTVPVGYG